MSVFSFPRLLLFAKPLENARLSVVTRREEYGDIRRGAVTTANRVWISPDSGVVVLRLSACQVLLRKFTAITELEPQTRCDRRRNYACCSSTFLLRVAYASRVKRCSFALRVQLCALSPREQSSIERSRARLGALPRYLGRTHTLRNHILVTHDSPTPLAHGARQPHGMKFGQSSLETHQLYQPYRAQAPTAMVT